MRRSLATSSSSVRRLRSSCTTCCRCTAASTSRCASGGRDDMSCSFTPRSTDASSRYLQAQAQCAG